MRAVTEESVDGRTVPGDWDYTRRRRKQELNKQICNKAEDMMQKKDRQSKTGTESWVKAAWAKGA